MSMPPSFFTTSDLWKALVDASSGHTMTSLAPWDMMKLACGCTHASEQRYTTIALTLQSRRALGGLDLQHPTRFIAR